MSFATRVPILLPRSLEAAGIFPFPSVSVSVTATSPGRAFSAPHRAGTQRALRSGLRPFAAGGPGPAPRDPLSSSPRLALVLRLSGALMAGSLGLFLTVSIFLFLFSISLSLLTFTEISQLLILNFFYWILKKFCHTIWSFQECFWLLLML